MNTNTSNPVEPEAQGRAMIPEDPALSTFDTEPAEAADTEPMRRNRRGGRVDMPSQGEETEHDEPRDAEQEAQREQPEAETKSEPEVEKVCGRRVHPAATVFPRYTEAELRELADDIKKNGQLLPIVLLKDGSILDGVNRTLACEIAGCVPRITTWDGKPGEELAFVISQNVRRRHLKESQRSMIASKLASLPSGQHQAGKFAGVPTQADAAKMMRVSERSVRTARKVQEEAPANLIRLVEVGRISLSAVEGSLPRLSTEDKQRIDGMPDDDVEAEVKRLIKQSATSKRRMEHATAKKPRAATTSPAIEVGANADDDDHDNRTIGTKAVSRALDRSDKRPDTPERKAFLSALECLPLSDAAWACDVASYVEQETREIENAVPVEEARSRRSQR
jgi:hypothetical protein